MIPLANAHRRAHVGRSPGTAVPGGALNGFAGHIAAVALVSGGAAGGAGRSRLPARLARANPAPDAERAGALQRESLALRQAIDDAVGVGRCLDGLGWVATAQGQLARSARLFGAAEALRERLGAGPHPPWRAEHEQRVAATRAGLGEAAFAEAWTEGRAPVPVD